MQANPLSTSVAREFLSERARDTWMPNRGTIVYEAFTVVPTTTGAASSGRFSAADASHAAEADSALPRLLSRGLGSREDTGPRQVERVPGADELVEQTARHALSSLLDRRNSR